MTLFALPLAIEAILSLVMFAAKAFALVDAATRRPDAFVAGDKLTKNAWLIILGLAVASHLLFWRPLGLLNLAGIVAALVYLLDVRPTLASLTRR